MVDDDKIYAGEYFMCHTDLVMDSEGRIAYVSGKMYKSEIDGAITDNFGLKQHFMAWAYEPNMFEKYFLKATKEEILDHFKSKEIFDYGRKMNAEILGEEEPIAYVVITPILVWPQGTLFHKGALDDSWYPERIAGSPVVQKMITDKSILNDPRLFKPIYSEEPKVIKVLMHSEPDNFELEVSKDGIYYRPENTFLNESDIHSIVSLEKRVKTYNGNKQYTFIPSHFDSGFKRMVPREDWLKVLSAYYSLINQ